MLKSILGWGRAGQLLELTDKVACIAHSHGVPDISNLRRGSLQQLSCPLHSELFEIAPRRLARPP